MDHDKKAELVERILDSGFTYFRQYGIRAVTLDEIALQLGISKKTIYEYFSGKDELVTSVIQKRVEHIQHKCMEYRKVASNAIEENILLMDYLDGLYRNMNPVILMDLQKFHPKAFQIFQQHMHEFVFQSIEENLARGIHEGLYRSDLNVEILSMFRLESSLLCFKPEVFPKDRFSMDVVQRELLWHYLYGISSPTGSEFLHTYRKTTPGS